jgi:hypothetical protein
MAIAEPNSRVMQPRATTTKDRQMKHLLFVVALAAVSSAFAGNLAERTQQPASAQVLKSDGFLPRCVYPMCGGKL